jgi:predicted transcriptional regulator
VAVDSSRTRRTQVDIIVRILTVASEGEEPTKTALVYRSNLNFTLVQKYIALLRRKGLLEMDKSRYGSTTYKITKKGSEALEALRSAIGLVFEEATTAVPP